MFLVQVVEKWGQRASLLVVEVPRPLLRVPVHQDRPVDPFPPEKSGVDTPGQRHSEGGGLLRTERWALHTGAAFAPGAFCNPPP